MAKIILQTQALTRSFDALVAVDHLNIGVPENSIFGLLGPNGAGKSTLIKMLTTLLEPTSGDALIAGESIVAHPRQIRTLIGYVPQLISADGTLTAYENLMFFAKLYKIPRSQRRERVLEALELMGLVDVADRYVSTYSGGMIRRLELVQAMLHHPKVLFLDEPTTGLDVVARNNLWEYLKAAHAAFNITVVITTHDMEEAEHLCDQVVIMDGGKAIVSGSPVELRQTLGVANATLGDVFMKYTGNTLERAVNYHALVRQRKTNKFLGG